MLDRDIRHENWLSPPYNRRSFQRVREIVPTARIHNSAGRTQPLPEAPVDLDGLVFVDGSGDIRELATYLTESFCDSIAVVHQGALVYERYFNGMTPETPHLLMSVSKSFAAAALGIAIGRGLLAVDDLVIDVAPEFAGSNLEGATVQQLVDMSAGTHFDEVYDHVEETPESRDWFDYERQTGYRPLGNHEPIGTMAHFRTLGSAFDHGTRFLYRSPLTDVVGRIVELANDLSYAEVLSRDLWGPLGQEHDANIMVDVVGQAVPDGAMSCSTRDLARFGLAYLQGGRVADQQVIPNHWIDDTAHGTNDALANFAVSPDRVEGWSHYRNAFWVAERDQVFTGWGIHGQFCWVDRRTDTVIARLSTMPEPDRDDDAADVHASMAAISAHLAGATT